MATTDKSGIQASISAGIRTGNSDTTALELRIILNEILDSYANVIDGGNVYQAPVGYNYLPSVLGAADFINKDYADTSYASSLINLAQVLANGYDTGNYGIISPDGDSNLNVVNGGVDIFMNSSLISAQSRVLLNDTQAIISFKDTVNGGSSNHRAAENTYTHTIKNKFTAPVNDFGTVQIYTGRVQLATSNIITWSSTVGGSPYVVGTTTVTSKGITIDATHTTSYTRIIQTASTTQASISMQSNVIAAWPVSEVKVDGFNKSALIDAPGAVNIGTTNALVINYGNASTVHNFLGTAIYELQVNSYVQDKLMTLNYGGSVSSAIGVGFEIEENSVITGYFKTNAARNGFSILTPSVAYRADLNLNLLTANKDFSLPNNSGTLALTSDISNLIKRVTFGDANYTMLIDDRVISTSVTLTSPRTITLVSGLSAGQSVVILDDFQAINSANNLIIAVPTGKKLNGVVNGTETIESTGGGRILYADGSDNFTFDAGIVRKNKAQTLTNKRNVVRVLTVTSSASIVIDTDLYDAVDITALAVNTTISIIGTPTNFQKLQIRFKDNGTARTITWSASFANKGNTLPLTTVANKQASVGTEWNLSVFGCLAYSPEV